jgi:hypothetical protein
VSEQQREPITDFLWRTWGALGVSSWSDAGATTVVDPESLIALTLIAGDERLLLETADWGVSHAHLLLPRRLMSLAKEIGQGELAAAWISTVGAHSPKVAWKTDPDLAFAAYRPSGKSRAYGAVSRPDSPGTNAALRLRAAAGASARTEVVRALHPVARGLAAEFPAAEVVWRAAVTRAQVNIALDELVGAQLVRRSGSQRRRAYAPAIVPGDPIAASAWHPWQALPYGPWREAPAICDALRRLHTALQEGGTRASAVDAVAAFADVQPRLARLDPSYGSPLRTGSADEVLAWLRPRASEMTSGFLRMLGEGIPPGSAVHGLPTTDA